MTEISVLQLYPREMNLYGDWGNALVLKRRLEWHGFTPKLQDYHPGSEFPQQVDIILGGGGQDNGQLKIHQDLLALAPRLQKLADDGTPMLMICGLFQLFGTSFVTVKGEKMRGIGIFDAETTGGTSRLSGNAVIATDDFGAVIGYENHSGRTYLGSGTQALGTVDRGYGNNAEDGTEGAQYHHVLASYLHGPILPKNPAIADFLIKTAAVRRYGEFSPKMEPILDQLPIQEARNVILQRSSVAGKSI